MFYRQVGNRGQWRASFITNEVYSTVDGQFCLSFWPLHHHNYPALRNFFLLPMRGFQLFPVKTIFIVRRVLSLVTVDWVIKMNTYYDIIGQMLEYTPNQKQFLTQPIIVHTVTRDLHLNDSKGHRNRAHKRSRSALCRPSRFTVSTSRSDFERTTIFQTATVQ